jgi:hypothetical protein
MPDSRLILLLAGAALILVAAGIFRRQAGAAACPHHSRLAGRLAVALGWVAMGCGVLLLLGA